MAIELVVVHPFAGHQAGDVIRDAAQVAAILAGEQAGRVVAIAVDDLVTADAPKKASEV